MATDVNYISRTVMIPIVVADSDETTFSYYWKMIALPQDKVILVHVFSSKESRQDKWQEKQQQVISVVAPFEGQCRKRNVEFQVILHTGAPGEGICALVKKHHPDLVVIGTRGLSSLRRTLESSVSEYVIRHANIPVLVVPNNYVLKSPDPKVRFEDEIVEMY